MSPSFIRSNERYAWHGQSLLLTNERGECGEDNSLSGYYFREARHLRTLRLEINGQAPWLCESAWREPESLRFLYVHPELAEFGGGGTGYADDAISRDAHGIPHRALDIDVTYDVGIASLDVRYGLIEITGNFDALAASEWRERKRSVAANASHERTQARKRKF